MLYLKWVLHFIASRILQGSMARFGWRYGACVAVLSQIFDFRTSGGTGVSLEMTLIVKLLN